MIGIIDYGMGNLQSVKNSCEHLGVKTALVSRPEELGACERLILPGVGAFSEGMENLKKSGLTQSLKTEAVRKKKPFLGICLGMQLLADAGTEGGENAGLGFIKGIVKRLDVPNLRVPHIGWNDITLQRDNPLLTPDMAADYYFVHSYYFDAADKETIVATCEYGISFPCVVGRGNIFGVQFHPEKSHAFGLRVLKNFFEIPC